MKGSPVRLWCGRVAILASAGLLSATLVGCASEPPLRVLFVGNSYTSANDLPGMVRELAGGAGQNLEVDMVAPGGWWWRDHAGSSQTADKIASEEWDYIVLQEQSMVTSVHDMAQRESRPAALNLAQMAALTGARTVLYMTWGHQTGNPEVGHSSYESMQIAIADTYWDIGDAVAGRVAPVGVAWWITIDERPDIGLYQADGSHPTAEGTYLASVVIAATLLDIDPNDFYPSLGLNEDTAEALRAFASRAVNGEITWSR